MKYHHPAVASGDVNWDYELFRILPQVTANISATEKQKALHQWISKFGPVKADGHYAVAGNAVLKPALGWINSAGFGKEVETLLDTIKNASRSEDGYYISLAPGVGNPDFRNENPYTNMPYPDAGFRLLSLFRYWNMIEYFFPYKHLIKEDWHAVLLEFIPKFINAEDEPAYKLAALELITRVKDTHANVYNQSPSLDTYFGNRYAAAQLLFIEGKPVVTDYYNASLAQQSGLKVGDVIEKINGKSVSELIKEKLPYTPGSNMPTRLRNMAPNLLRSNDSLMSVRIKRDSKVMDLKIPAHAKEDINLYANYNKKDTCFKLIEPDIAYLFPGKFKNDYLPAIAPEISKTKALIIDMRCYPSDFMVFTFAPYLLPEARAFVKFTKGSMQTPGQFTFTPELKTGKIEVKPTIKGISAGRDELLERALEIVKPK